MPPGFGASVPRVASPAEDRALALHALAEKVSVIVVDVPYLRQVLEQARYYPGIPTEVLNVLAEALAVLTSMEVAAAATVPLFERVRKVV